MSTETAPSGDRVLAFAHIGDLDLTDAKQRNFTDFLSIAAQIEMQCATTLDFAVLSGDNADNGRPGQYAPAATALTMLSRPVHIIPGDHDMGQGGLDAFHAGLGGAALPKSLTVRGTRCLFLDISGPGGGGPDFRLGRDQIAWLERELTDATLRRQTSVVFTHTYPDNLRGDGETEAINSLLREGNAALERSCIVRALVVGREAIRSVSCRTEDGAWTPMVQAQGERVWTAELAIPNDRLVTIEVQAVDTTGRPGQHAIKAATTAYPPPNRVRAGSDADAIGAWPENGIFGTQLGPNRNGVSTS